MSSNLVAIQGQDLLAVTLMPVAMRVVVDLHVDLAIVASYLMSE